MFNRVAKEKWTILRGEKNIFIKKRKLLDHMLQKGYEAELIHEFLDANS